MTQRCQLSLLGSAQVTCDGQPVHGFESRKALALLCYLAARNEPLDRTHLADLFWHDKSEAKGRANLSGIVHNLTTLFPNSLRADRHTIQLEPEHFLLDVNAFDAHVRVGTAQALTAAAELYHDEFMAGMYLDDCPDFEVWLVAERERWRQRQVSVLECLEGYYVRREDYARALHFAARLLDLEPRREESHWQMMDLLARTGQRSAALQQFEICRRVLAQELGVEPSRETTALYAKIRAEELTPTPRVAPRHNLPTQLTSFVGRETDVVRIAARLNNPECRLLTLVGAGGCGKTRLALEAAAELLGSFRDGIYFVPLAALNSPALIVSEIAEACEFKFVGATNPETQLVHFLQNKQTLLLIDNWEHLLGGVTIVNEILKNARGVKILATSREPLNLQAEWLMRVEGLSYPPSRRGTSDGTGVLHYHAVQLFLERAQRADEHFALNADTTAPAVRICQIVEGMPLAIELAAAAIKRFSVKKISEQIASNLDLRTPLQDIELRHHSLRAVLDWSYALLSEPEKVLFRRLAVFAGGWTFEAAEGVCTGDGIDSFDVLELLAHLVDKSLVATEAYGEETRYRMLEPVREYARDKLSESGDAEAVRERHLYFLIQLAEESEWSLLGGADQISWLRRWDLENDNLRAALAWALENDHAAGGLQLAGTVRWYWLARRPLEEARKWLQECLKRSESADPRYRAKSLEGAAWIELFDDNPELARPLAEQSFALYQASADKLGMAWSLIVLGDVVFFTGDHMKTCALYGESLALGREINDSLIRLWALHRLGQVAVQQGEYDQAHSFFEESLGISKSIGDRWSRAVLLDELGFEALFRLGKYEQAAIFFTEALALSREVGRIANVAYALLGLGSAARFQGKFKQAATFYKEILSLDLARMGKEVVTLCFAGSAGLAFATGSMVRAVQLYAMVDVLCEPFRKNIDAWYQAEWDRNMTALQTELDEATFTKVWAEGRAMTMEQAIAYALEDDDSNARFIPSD